MVTGGMPFGRASEPNGKHLGLSGDPSNPGPLGRLSPRDLQGLAWTESLRSVDMVINGMPPMRSELVGAHGDAVGRVSHRDIGKGTTRVAAGLAVPGSPML